MPTKTFVSLILIVLAAAAATIYVGLMISGSGQTPTPAFLAGASLIALCAYAALRLFGARDNGK